MERTNLIPAVLPDLQMRCCCHSSAAAELARLKHHLLCHGAPAPNFRFLSMIVTALHRGGLRPPLWSSLFTLQKSCKALYIKRLQIFSPEKSGMFYSHTITYFVYKSGKFVLTSRDISGKIAISYRKENYHGKSGCFHS